ncbi:putative LysR family transcriptional regulator [Oscillibacter valericigenes Sjm18-20]|nr:putative LysR family transcriptional regulator [Oscillibacter valericigenes Sjm18-20]
MTFQQLSYVVEVSKCGSINKAAHHLFLSQSGISTAIRDLEDELGIHFFNRSNRGVEFTPEGEEFVSYAISLLEQKRRIESLYSSARFAPAPVRFSVSTQRYPFAEDAFLRLLKAMDAPGYSLSIRETGMDAVIQDVCEHRADVGVIFISDLTEKIIRRRMDAQDVEFHELAAVPPCIYVRREHPLTCCIPLTEAKLAEYPYACFEHDQGAAADFSEEYQLLPDRKPDRNICVNSRTTMMEVLAATDAFTTGSGLLTAGLSDERVISIPLEGRGNVRLGWLRAKNTKATPQAEKFLRLLAEATAEAAAFTRTLQERRVVRHG